MPGAALPGRSSALLTREETVLRQRGKREALASDEYTLCSAKTYKLRAFLRDPRAIFRRQNPSGLKALSFLSFVFLGERQGKPSKK